MTPLLAAFCWGALAAMSAVAGLAFVKYWTITRDRLFLFFSGAFWMLGSTWAVLAIVAPADESRHYVYVLRLGAFLLILIGIIDKNRKRAA